MQYVCTRWEGSLKRTYYIEISSNTEFCVHFSQNVDTLEVLEGIFPLRELTVINSFRYLITSVNISELDTL